MGSGIDPVKLDSEDGRSDGTVYVGAGDLP